MTGAHRPAEARQAASSLQQRPSSTQERLRFLTMLLDAVEQSVIATDCDGRILYWNRFAEQLYGWRADEVADKNIADVLLPEPVRDRGRSAIAAIVSGGEPAPREWLLRRRDGSTVCIRAGATPILDDNGNRVGVVGVSWDISGRKRLEEERRLAEDALKKSQRQLVEAQKLAHVGSWEWDPATGAVTLSDEARRIYCGNQGRELTGSELFELVHPDDRERLRRLREDTTNPEPTDIEYRIVQSDGTVRVVHSRAEIVGTASGQPLSVIGSILDITERKRVEEEVGRRVRQQAAVAELGLRALGGAAIQTVLDAGAALVASTFDVEYCVVMEAIPNEGSLVMRAGAGPWKEGTVGRATVSANTGNMGWYVMQAMGPVVVDDLALETRFVPCPVLLEHGVASGVSVPIHGPVRPFGVLGAHAKSRRSYTQDDLHFLWSIANVLATTIERQRVEGELREKREQLQALSHRLLETQETERRLLARELHDDFGQFLTAIRLNLQALDGAGAEPVVESIAMVDQAIEQVRSMALDLRPSILDDLGLVAALRSLLNRQSQRAGFEGHLSVATLDTRLPAAVETCCFRLAQEALTNVARHAGARHVRIEVHADGRDVRIVIRDDGRGFDVRAARERAAHGASLGLFSMEERVSLAGGRLEIRSALGEGTAVHACFPLSGGDVA